jgi:pimeloyl-ACP methyl ester carboxylesterase
MSGAEPLSSVRSFYVGGEYVELPGGVCMVGQMYVSGRRPALVRQPHPIVMVHGGGGSTAKTFETKPDGKPGWADYFVARGFEVYLIDQPGRGRSGFLAGVNGAQAAVRPTGEVEARGSAPEHFDLWPQARLHTQWPGSGRVGDPVFDQLYAAQCVELEDDAEMERRGRKALSALLDQIGDAIVLTHSQSGALGWHVADSRPGAVQAVVAVEPPGPPFARVAMVGAPHYFKVGDVIRPYGITSTALTYDPPVNDPTRDLRLVESEDAGQDGIPSGLLQAQPPRRLVNVSQAPVLLLTGEASYHAPYDHWTVRYLRQAGVNVTHEVLAKRGIRGNGHLMMLEKNSDVIAGVILTWLQERGLARA